MKALITALALLAGIYAGAALAEVNINTAGADKLTELTGIGPSKADAIIRYREENGDFESVEALDDVTGIGDKTVEGLRANATASAADADEESM